MMVTDPDVDVSARWRADCPHCHDHSLAREIRGRVAIGCTDHVVHTTTEEVDGVIRLGTALSPSRTPR